MSQIAKKYYTPAEYLALEESADHKSEYYDGEIFATSGGSANHNRIAGNIFAALNTAFKRKACEVFNSDMRVLVQTYDFYTYPDVSVVCGKIEFAKGRNDTITNPIVIVEVLSKATKNYDRGRKFDLYRAIKTLQDYVLIDQQRPYIEYFHRLADGTWALEEYEGLKEKLHLRAIEFEMSLRSIYNKVEFAPTRLKLRR